MEKKNHSVNRLQRDLCIDAILNPPLFSLINTFKTNNISIYTELQKLFTLYTSRMCKILNKRMLTWSADFFIIIEILEALPDWLTRWVCHSSLDSSMDLNISILKTKQFAAFFKNRVQIQKEVISDLKRANQFLSREIWVFKWKIPWERSLSQLKYWIIRAMSICTHSFLLAFIQLQ